MVTSNSETTNTDTLESVLNTTRTLINDNNSDPLNPVPQTEETPAEGTEEEEAATPEEEEKPDEVEAFRTNLDSVLMEKAGVGIDGMVEALVELLTWRNDILSLEVEKNKQQTKTPTRTPTAPKAQGRESLSAKSHDFRKSEILAMSKEDYAKNAQAITEAYMKGRVLQDV